MHEHCEIVMPPTDAVEAAVGLIMKQFDENSEDCAHPFWDFWSIGGRFAGAKQMAKCDKAKLDAFQQWLRDKKITVAGLQCGKQEISPVSQVPKVDAKWNEFFPPANGDQQPCPIFQHSNDQYSHGAEGHLAGDICTLPKANGVTCERVIFAAAGFNSAANEFTGPLEAKFMLCRSQWNGVNHMDVVWDGTLADAVAKFRENVKHYKDSYREQWTPRDDWLTVTVDYHT